MHRRELPQGIVGILQRQLPVPGQTPGYEYRSLAILDGLGDPCRGQGAITGFTSM